jgi:DNA-binding NarL/FixJ family response regulator
MKNKNSHIAIVEDQKEVGESLLDLLMQSGQFASVTHFGNAEAFLTSSTASIANLCILDIGLPGMDGLECLVRFKAFRADSKVLMFTIMEHDDKVFAALKSGADGYLLKRESPEKIVDSIKDALHGGAPMSSEIARRVLLTFRNDPIVSTAAFLISEREMEVLNLLSKGHLYKEIADLLGISLNTVKRHIHHIYEKLQVQNRTEAVLRFLKNDL